MTEHLDSKTSIVTVARDCRKAFDHLTELELTTEWHEWAEEQQARLNMWIASLGVFARGHASIEYRLRDSPKTQQLLHRVLLLLYSNLDYCLQRGVALKVGRGWELGEDTVDQDEELSTSGSSQTSGEASHQSVRLDIQAQEDATAAISRLNRLTTAIRRPGVHRSDKKADSFLPKGPDGEDLLCEFESYAEFLLGREIPVDNPLVDNRFRRRTLALVIQRWRLIYYRRSHRQKLARENVNERQEHKSHNSQIKPSEATNSDDSQRKSHTALASEINPSTIATDMERHTIIEEQQPAIEKAPSQITKTSVHGKRLELPRAPAIPKGNDVFDCPYCCILCPKEDASRGHWKHHLIRDLAPYYCLHDDCSDKMETFRSFNEWIQHMHIHMPREWHCTFPGCEHLRPLTETDYKRHIRLEHTSSMTEARIKALSSINSRPTTQLFAECRFCGGFPEEYVGQPDAQVRLQRHIERHMHQIALISLPFDDLDVQSYTSGASHRTPAGNGADDYISKTTSESEKDRGRRMGHLYNPVFNDPPDRERSDADRDILEYAKEVCRQPEGLNEDILMEDITIDLQSSGGNAGYIDWSTLGLASDHHPAPEDDPILGEIYEVQATWSDIEDKPEHQAMDISFPDLEFSKLLNNVQSLPTERPQESKVEDEDIIMCICGYDSDDGQTIQCERCNRWNHIECYYPSEADVLHMPQAHYCTDCEPREVDIQRASALQKQKREDWQLRELSDPKTSPQSQPNIAEGTPPPKKRPKTHVSMPEGRSRLTDSTPTSPRFFSEGLRRVSNNQELYECPYCSANLADQSDLQDHIQHHIPDNHDIVQDRVRMASTMHLQPSQQSPTETKSPFRPGSPLAPLAVGNSDSSESRGALLAGTAAIRQRQVAETNAIQVEGRNNDQVSIEAMEATSLKNNMISAPEDSNNRIWPGMHERQAHQAAIAKAQPHSQPDAGEQKMHLGAQKQQEQQDPQQLEFKNISNKSRASSSQNDARTEAPFPDMKLFPDATPVDYQNYEIPSVKRNPELDLAAAGGKAAGKKPEGRFSAKYDIENVLKQSILFEQQNEKQDSSSKSPTKYMQDGLEHTNDPSSSKGQERDSAAIGGASLTQVFQEHSLVDGQNKPQTKQSLPPQQPPNYQLELMLLEQQKKKRLLKYGQEGSQAEEPLPPPPAPQDFQFQLMLLEQQNKERLRRYGQEVSQAEKPLPPPPAPQDYQLQLLLLEQQNKKRLLMAKQEHDLHNESLANAKAPDNTPLTHQQPRVTSYWSISEQADFIKLVGQFGTDFAGIASHMGTKTKIMCKNRYLRLTESGDHPDIIEAAEQANARPGGVENISPPFPPPPPPENSAQHSEDLFEIPSSAQAQNANNDESEPIVWHTLSLPEAHAEGYPIHSNHNRSWSLEPEGSTHENRVQKHPATFQCTLCPKRYTRAHNLRSHLRTHTEERPFSCTICGRRYVRLSDLKRHEEVHTGEKKFICLGHLKTGEGWGCGRRFARADALGRHFRSEPGRICIKPLLDEEAAEKPSLSEAQLPMPLPAAEAPEPQTRSSLPAALLATYPALASFDWGSSSTAQDSAALFSEGEGVASWP